MPPLRDPTTMSEREVFVTVAKDSTLNLFWYGIVAVVIALIGNLLWWAGVVLLCGFALFALVSSLHPLIGAAMGIFTIFLALNERRKGRSFRLSEQVYLGAANLIQIAESVVIAGYAIWLYVRFF